MQILRKSVVASVVLAVLLTTVGMAQVAVAAAAKSTLGAGQTLSGGETLFSTNGRYRAVLQGDGNFVVYDGRNAAWSTRTTGSGITRAVMQSDGNLVLYKGTAAKWSSGTSAGGGGGRLVMQNDGNLVVYTGDGRPAWSSKGGRTGNTNAVMVAGYTLKSGNALRSPNGRYRAVVQSDGNFVVYDGRSAAWSTRTNGPGTTRAVMQRDGNFVVYRGNVAKWSSGTSKTDTRKIAMQDDGNLVARTAAGVATWSRKSGRLVEGNAGLSDFKAWTLNRNSWKSSTDVGNPGIDVDGAYGAQCADLAIAWSQRLGRPVGFDGWDSSSLTKAGWHPVAGSLANAREGDVVTRVGGIRHVVVVLSAPSNGTVQVLQQNPLSPHVKSYSTTTVGVIWRLD